MGSNNYLEKEVNKKLGTDIEWSQLPSDDLEEFHDMLQDEMFIKRIAGQYMNTVVGDETQKQIENWTPGQFAEMVSGEDADIKETIEFLKMMI